MQEEGGQGATPSIALPVFVPEEVLQANPKFKELLTLLAAHKIKPNGVSIGQHQKYEQVLVICNVLHDTYSNKNKGKVANDESTRTVSQTTDHIQDA